MIPGAVQQMVSSYMENLRPFTEQETAYTWDDSPPFDTIHNRIHQMWYSGSEPDTFNHQHVHCTAVKGFIPIRIKAECGQTHLSKDSRKALLSIEDELRQYKRTGVKWVYIPIGMFWDNPLPFPTITRPRPTVCPRPVIRSVLISVCWSLITSKWNTTCLNP